MLVLLERSDARLRPLFRLHRPGEEDPNASSEKEHLPVRAVIAASVIQQFFMSRTKGMSGHSKPTKVTRSVSPPYP
jgi:hypothetical protein